MKAFFLFLSFALLLFAQAPTEILLLHSYNKGLKWTDGISKGVESVFEKNSEYELTTEYMDTKKIDTPEYFEALFNLYEKKFAKRDYKAIITSDNYAFNFALKYHEILFKNTPIIFCGAENFDKKDIPLHLQRFVTGVIEYKEIEKNVKLIKTMIPNINTLYIVSDNSFSSLAIKNQILDSIKPYERDFYIIYDNDIQMDKIESKINSLPNNSAVLFTSLYKDKFGNYIPYNRLRALFRNSQHPIFALNRIHLGEGILGGVMINPFDQGFIAANKTIEVLQGKLPLQIEITKPLTHTYFDYNILKKYNFDPKLVPLGATIINEPQNFFDKNREVIDSVFVLMPLLVLLIIGLIVNISRRISLEVKMSEQNKLDNVLLNNIKDAIFWKSNDGVLLGCNDTFCSMLKMKKEDIIGQPLTNVLPEVCSLFSDKKTFVSETQAILYNLSKKPMNVLIRRKQYLNKNNEPAGIVTVLSDVTEIKKLQLQRQKEEQFVVQRSKLSEIGEMITSIAHQWKNPLVEISSIAQELMYKQKRVNITQAEAREFVDDIMKQVEYMTNTIDDFRAFIKPSAKKSDFSIEEAIKGLIKVIHNSLKYNYIKLDVHFFIKDYEMIYGYANEFKQAILSIINNAKDSIVKRREEEGIEGSLKINVYEKDSSTIIDIIDNGVGIPEKNLEKIFEPFFTCKENGDGFGLYMAKVLIEDKMGGKIEALKVSEGATIRVTLFHKKEKDEDTTS
jgi:signal transduction histidine kinase